MLSNTLDTDDLFHRATGKAEPEQTVQYEHRSLLKISTKSSTLNLLLNENLSQLLVSVIDVEKKRKHAKRIDGLIIGTGEADFTKGNTVYTLNYKEKIFQLMDVPGIEGNEEKYEHLVREAIAKAHLVFYVNGTNKKPEKTTAEKIQTYLRRGTQVFPIVNIRGNADSYEFIEDRISLNNNETNKSLEQTMSVLESVLGQDVLLSGHCIQGLLAFCSLAMDQRAKNTSIHPSREMDLVIQQRNYLKYFENSKVMFDFSQLAVVAQLLNKKLETFKEDIIESNKIKVRELLLTNVDILKGSQLKHETFINKIEPEFSKCKLSIAEAVKAFQNKIKPMRKNLYERFFQDIVSYADEAIKEYYGDQDLIERKIVQEFQKLKNNLERNLQETFKKEVETLQADIEGAIQRLVQDVQRIEFLERKDLEFEKYDLKFAYHSAELNMGLGWKRWGGILFQIGSYAFAGFGIGTAFPIVGNLIGAAVGAAVGLVMSVAQVFMSKDKRIRKTQSVVQEKFDEMRKEVLLGIEKEIIELMKLVNQSVKETALGYVSNMHTQLALQPLTIIRQQIELMKNINKKLEEMPYGTIQAIQP
jgi:hypothetical protein